MTRTQFFYIYMELFASELCAISQFEFQLQIFYGS